MGIKHQRKRPEIRSRSLHVRVRDEERAALQAFAASLGQTPSRILRRLLREAITGGPDYFTDELVGVRSMSRELAAVGNNLNQIARALNRGERVELAAFKRVANATLVQVAAAAVRYDQTLKAVRQRTVVALSGAERGVRLKRGGRRFGPLQ